jgi:Flp pilus assembly protein TadD
MAGNTAEAEKWFAQAIELAPKLPQVYIDRGHAQLDRGDLAGAFSRCFTVRDAQSTRCRCVETLG